MLVYILAVELLNLHDRTNIITITATCMESYGGEVIKWPFDDHERKSIIFLCSVLKGYLKKKITSMGVKISFTV